MLIVKVDKKGGIERALKNYKYKVIKTKQLNNLRDGRYYEKPTTKKRRQLEKAKYNEKRKGSEY
jgi:small subunit ribosomal protein S21